MLLLAYFCPIREVVHVLLIFLGIDFISGIWASVKEGNHVKSYKLRRTVYKFIWYTVAVMAAYMMEITFHLAWSRMANITGGVICIVELTSIFENISRITGEPIFKIIITIFRRKAPKSIQEMLDEEAKVKND